MRRATVVVAAGSWPRRRALPRRRSRKRGQALIEFTFFFSFIMLLLAGVTDVAFMIDAHVNVVYAARQGARTGSVLGPKSDADCAILGTIHATLQAQSDVTLQQVIIYKALPPTYLPAADHSNQEVYTGAALCTPPKPGSNTPPTPPTPPALIYNNYPYSVRNDTPFKEDSLGVQITYTYQFRFNLWQGGTLTVTDASVYPINSDILPTPPPTPTP